MVLDKRSEGPSGKPYTGKGRLAWLKWHINDLMKDKDTRNLGIFIVVSSIFTSAEMWHGLSVNSLGLISDGTHMLFHILALSVSLMGMVLAQQAPTVRFSYGYRRCEVLATFSNTLFLIFVCLMLATKALHRIFNPEEMEGECLLEFGIVGFIINLGGIVAFGKRRASRFPVPPMSSASEGSARATNMQAVYIHIATDAASSLCVIASALLVRWQGWTVVDSLQSTVVALMTLYTVIPLFKTTGLMLLQTTPVHVKTDLDRCIREVDSLPGVLECYNHHFWMQSPGEIVGTVFVRVRSAAAEQDILSSVTKLLSRHVHHLTVQVEKDPPIDWWLAGGAGAPPGAGGGAPAPPSGH